MALFNHAAREVTAKVVYYGPGLCGKTTNLQWIHDHLSFESRGKLVSLATQTDRTLFFDCLPLESAVVQGMRLRVQIYTVPGEVVYESTCRMVLRGCDAVVFVADSQAARLDANAESLRSLQRNLLANEIDPAVPMVVQLNKRDLPTALPISALNARLNPRGLPFFEAVALEGRGVEETFRGITKAVSRSLLEHGGDAETGGGPASGPASGDALARDDSRVPGEPPRPPAPSSPDGDPPPQGEGLREEQWLYLRDGVQAGPVDIEDLIDLVLTSVPESTKVWHPGLEGWVHAHEVRAIAEEIPPPLPVPGAARGSLLEEDMPDFATVPPQFRTALIADESEDFRRYLAGPLAAQGFTILEAADGSAAWQLVEQNRPWLILADTSLPGVDGFELCSRVRRHPSLGHTPVLFISDSDKYEERYRALQTGADDFLSKQMPIRELLMRIQLLLTRYSDVDADQQQPDGRKD
jgi:CheY-like chemotaxis protein/signal recognition particle receptor subunit beta